MVDKPARSISDTAIGLLLIRFIVKLLDNQIRLNNRRDFVYILLNYIIISDIARQ